MFGQACIACAALLICQKCLHCLRQRRSIVNGHQTAKLSVIQSLFGAGTSRRDNGLAKGHGLYQYDWISLITGRHHEYIATRYIGVRIVLKAQQTGIVTQLVFVDIFLQYCTIRTFTKDGQMVVHPGSNIQVMSRQQKIKRLLRVQQSANCQYIQSMANFDTFMSLGGDIFCINRIVNNRDLTLERRMEIQHRFFDTFRHADNVIYLPIHHLLNVPG